MSEPTTAAGRLRHDLDRLVEHPGSPPRATAVVARVMVANAVGLIEAEARALLEAQVAELRAADETLADALWTVEHLLQPSGGGYPDRDQTMEALRVARQATGAPVRHRSGCDADLRRDGCVCTDDPTARVALRWLRSPEGQERLAKAHRHAAHPNDPRRCEHGRLHEMMVAAIVAALAEER